VNRPLPVGFLRHELGQSLVEISLLLPVVAIALIGGADLARAFAMQMAVQNGARAGAEAYAIDQSPTTAAAINRTLDEMTRTPGMNWTNCVITGDTCHDAGAPGDIRVTLAQSDGVLECVTPPTIATPCFVTVSVQYAFRTIVPWPLVPNVAHFDRSTTMRTFY